MKIELPEVPARWRVPAAFAAVYTIWGSTYLGIRFAVETLPPFLMAGTRFLIAGTILYAIMRRRGAPAPIRLHWRSAFIVGALMLLAGNGGVVWAEQVVPSSIASLMVATVPLWMVIFNWVRGDRIRPTAGVAAGLAMGMVGILLLVSAGRGGGGQTFNAAGLVVLSVGSLSWAIGSLYSRRAPLPGEALLGTAMEMLAGGALLFLAGLVTGEAGHIAWQNVSSRSVLALVYLILLGSLIGFSAYIWLLRNSTPARVSTYAFVNPIVAVFLGWGLGGEPLTARTLIAAAVIVGGVALITTYQPRTAPARGPDPRLQPGEECT
ncbi:MAG: drug/metabolite exporter YedA [Anaerolineaceae bacterium]|nr:drug/metabolite exporter YedA [Anaerolineaceae bacterium]